MVALSLHTEVWCSHYECTAIIKYLHFNQYKNIFLFLNEVLSLSSARLCSFNTDLTINGDDQYMLAGARPIYFNRKNHPWRLMNLQSSYSEPAVSFSPTLAHSLPNLSAKLSFSISLSLLQMGPTHSHMALLHNIQHIKPFSSCKTSKNNQAVIWKMSPRNMLLVSSFRFSIHTVVSNTGVCGQKHHVWLNLMCQQSTEGGCGTLIWRVCLFLHLKRQRRHFVFRKILKHPLQKQLEYITLGVVLKMFVILYLSDSYVDLVY